MHDLYNDSIYPASELNSKLAVASTGLIPADEILSYVSIAPLLINIASACFCLGCSALFHLYYVKSPAFNDFLSRLDYGGISVLIFGSCMPVLSYGFACKGEQVTLYVLLGIFLSINLACFVTSLIKEFDKPKFRPLRGGMFIFAGLSTVAIFATLFFN